MGVKGCNPECDTHKQIFVYTCGFFLACLLGVWSIATANAEKGRSVIHEHEVKNYESFEKLNKDMAEGFSDLRQRLSRIEGKLQ